MTGKVNNINYLVTMAPLGGWDLLGIPMNWPWDSQGSLMHVRSEGRPNRRAIVVQIAERIMLVLIERSQNTQYLAVCCIIGCVAPDQSV